MIESEIIVYSFIAAGLISAICFGVFIWMNLKDRSIDEKRYWEKTDPRKLVSKYKHTGAPLDDEPDPIESLRKYAVKGREGVPLDQKVVLSEDKVVEEIKQELEILEQQPIAENKEFAPPWLKETKEE